MQDQPLRTVRIDGFRGLRRLELEDLGPINILVGPNNCGKTSILEAVSILSSPFDPYEWLAMIRRRDFGGLDESRLQSLRWCFHQSRQDSDPEALFESRCAMSCEGRFAVRRLVVEYQEILGEPDPREIERYWRHRGKGREELGFDEAWRGAQLTPIVEIGPETTFPFVEGAAAEPLTVWEQMPIRPMHRARRRRGSLPNETLTPYSYQINRLQVSSHSKELLTEKRKELALELIREFDPAIRDIQLASFHGDRPAIYIDHAELGLAPLSVFGDALRRAVLLASTLYGLRGGVLLIDEVETGIHVSGLQRVFSWLLSSARRLNVQVIATTHSLEAVDGILDVTANNVEDIVTFQIEQQPNQTQAKRISGDVVERLRRERGLDIR